MRLGLRLTARQTEEKSTDKAGDKSADGADKPADGAAAEPDRSGQRAGSRTGGASAADDEVEDTLAGGDLPVAGGELADVNTAIGGEDLADMDTSETEGTLAGGSAPGTGAEAVSGAAVAGAVGTDTAELNTGEEAELDKDGQTAVLPGPGEAPAGPPRRPGRLRRFAGRLGQIVGLGVAARGLHKLGASRGMRRLGAAVAPIARLWQAGPGVREAADPGGRAFAMVTVMPSLLLIAWLL